MTSETIQNNMKSKFAITGLTMGSEAHKWLEYSTLDVVPISDSDHYHLYDCGVVTIKKYSESNILETVIYSEEEFAEMLKAKENDFLIFKDGKARVPKEVHDRIKMDFKSVPKNTKELDNYFKTGIAPVPEDDKHKDLRAIPYQRCPICNGHGRVTNFGTSSSLYDLCSVCDGTKIIPMCIMGRDVDVQEKLTDNTTNIASPDELNLNNAMDLIHIFRNWGIQWDIMFSKNPKNVDDLAAEISKKYNVTRK